MYGSLQSLGFVLENGMRKVTGLNIPKTNYWETFLGWEMFKSVWKSRVVDITKEMRNGLEAQNVPLVTPDGKKYVRLLDLLQAERAVVVYFGSCSCPVFMNKLKEFGVLAQDFSDIVDFVVVYIEEAHPIDGWSFKNNFIKVRKHRNQYERCKAAQKLQELNLPCQIMVDTMDDNANVAYGALPERLYAIEEGKVAYVGGQGPMNSSMKAARDWLESYREKNTFRRWTI
ncbi:thyroxine 5-deiodinase-like [Xenia sp. Carnegie-2017]|uniref:thyroxine 5-deiodinase-like n=1 Tax=Xenia sp. Carnegie-2017 TaxID=2897299 RepID=UPI001F0445DB|nr:thyroxine 5-deiodinase-like [Xenia sp. Carnegie-2017]